MSRVRVACFGVSVDGYGAGPDQSIEHPLGVGGTALHEWVYPTRTFQQRVLGSQQGDAGGADEDFAARGFRDVGAWILGRNMFGPVRGPWSVADEWNGWWGDNPPYHMHVFVLTHHPRTSVVMEGGTVFHFVTEGIEVALERARASAGPDRDVRIGGGVATVRQYLQAGLVDELHLAVAPVTLGRGECLLRDLDLPALGFRCVEHVGTPHALHVVLRKGA